MSKTTAIAAYTSDCSANAEIENNAIQGEDNVSDNGNG